VEAFPFDSAPRYVMRDRDSIYGKRFRTRVKSLGIEEVVTAPRSPWQNPYVERIIGSIRRECLNHVIIFNERHLRHVLKSTPAIIRLRERTCLSISRARYHDQLNRQTKERSWLFLMSAVFIMSTGERPD